MTFSFISKNYKIEKLDPSFLFELVLEAEGIKQTGLKYEVNLF